MKKSLISTSVAILLASTSAVTLASSVTISNTFTSGTPAMAAEVNANFDDVAVGVNDNDSRITTNASGISTNASGISTNVTNIGTNTGNISTNITDIGTNADAIATNAADISDLQSGASCPTDMVAAGSICVDQYEASIWDAPSGGNQLSPTADVNLNDAASFYRCVTDGSDCGDSTANAATAIYARSVSTLPALQITWYQAAQACANVGKRLPTTAEWQMAASGTVLGGGAAPDCNAKTGASLANTGASPNCVSTVGAFDMIGNVMEWSADLPYEPSTATGVGSSKTTNTDNSNATVLGDGYKASIGVTPSTKIVFRPGSGPLAVNNQIGFRCVK